MLGLWRLGQSCKGDVDGNKVTAFDFSLSERTWKCGCCLGTSSPGATTFSVAANISDESITPSLEISRSEGDARGTAVGREGLRAAVACSSNDHTNACATARANASHGIAQQIPVERPVDKEGHMYHLHFPSVSSGRESDRLCSSVFTGVRRFLSRAFSKSRAMF